MEYTLPPEEVATDDCHLRSENRAVTTEDLAKLTSIPARHLKEIKMYRIIQDIAFYALYLILLVIVASHNRDSNSFQMKQTLMNVISPRSSLSEIKSIPEFWHWMETVILPNLYITTDWNDEIFSEATRLISTQASYRVGPVRLRQQRVDQDICDRPSKVLPYVETCSFDLGQAREATTSYLEGWTSVRTNKKEATMELSDPWEYRTTMQVDGVPFAGEVGVYSGGGYIADLIGQRSHVIKMADYLKTNSWIDKWTRIVFVEFTTYNPNVNLFTDVQISFEMPTTGIIVSRTQIYTFRLFSYLGGLGIFVILCELAALVCVMYFLALELRHIKGAGRRHFNSFWNCLQFLKLMISLTCVMIYLLRHAMTSAVVERITKLKDKYYNFQRIAMWDELFQILLGIIVFASILKLIHILRFNRRMSMLAGTLKLSAKEMATFSLVFMIVLFSFVASGYLLFGAEVREFKTTTRGFETLLSFSLGSFDFQGVLETSRILGPIYFLFFFIFVVFVLLNVFVTILNEAFVVVRQDVLRQNNEYEIIDFISTRIKRGLEMTMIKPHLMLKQKHSECNY